MSDRALLEMAAKAAGIENILWHDSDAGGWVRSLNGHPWWNPLADDGDALRLAVKLRIDVDYTNIHSPKVHAMADTKTHVSEDGSADPYAATRRAITRAAAEIGKGMP